MRSKFLVAVLLLAAAGCVVSAGDSAEARAILDRAIGATGGEEALSRIKAVRYRGKGSLFTPEKKMAGTFEWTYEGFDRSRGVSVLDDDGKKSTEVEVVNADKGWVKDDDQQTEELTKDQVASGRETIYANWATMLVPLKAPGVRLAPLAETTVLGRRAVGILVTQNRRPDLKMYFDKESGLLVKLERKFNDVEGGKVVTEETLYSENQDVQGTKQPSRATTFWDGKKVSDVTVTETRLFEKPLDETQFSKP
jgi:major membrane immunogen (membrane-anchored lipoprotein)